jgi:hypothetical protein
VSFPAKVERWRPLVLELATDLPPDLVLGIIWHESGGIPGILSTGTTKAAKVPTSAGGEKKANHAFGLMQVIPRNVAGWNSEHPEDLATWELMSGTSEAAARMQIRLGLWILRDSLSWLQRYGFPWPAGALTDDQIKIGLMIYAWGAHNLEPYLAQLQNEGAPVTASEIATRWPDMGAPKNAPVKFSQRVWNKAFGGGVGGPVSSQPVPTRGNAGAVTAFVLGGLLAWIFSKK